MKKKDLSSYPYSAEFWESMIDRYVVGFKAERNRAILKRALIDGIGYERLAEEHLLSVSQVKRIVYKAQEQLFRHL